MFYSFLFVKSGVWGIYKCFEQNANEIYSNFEPDFPFNVYSRKNCCSYHYTKKYVEEKTKMFHDQKHKDEALKRQQEN